MEGSTGRGAIGGHGHRTKEEGVSQSEKRSRLVSRRVREGQSRPARPQDWSLPCLQHATPPSLEDRQEPGGERWLLSTVVEFHERPRTLTLDSMRIGVGCTNPSGGGGQVEEDAGRPGREGLELVGKAGGDRDVLVGPALEVDVVAVEGGPVGERAGEAVAAVVLCGGANSTAVWRGASGSGRMKTGSRRGPILP